MSNLDRPWADIILNGIDSRADSATGPGKTACRKWTDSDRPLPWVAKPCPVQVGPRRSHRSAYRRSDAPQTEGDHKKVIVKPTAIRCC